MNFFQQQENALSQSVRLSFLFVLALVGVVLTMYVSTLLVSSIIVTYFDLKGGRVSAQIEWWQPEVFSGVSIIVIGIIVAGSLYKIAALRGGGRQIAMMMRAREVLPNSVDEAEAQLMNVVAEMSIASGVPMPSIFVMNGESSINAFAAGYSSGEAIVVVTRGCLERLTRAELQGVIGHEFSHILHGDMRLNIHMMGLIHGLVVIGQIGYWTLRAAGEVCDSREGAKVAIPLALVGGTILIIGSVGVLFGQIIQSAVCRQREFLADASALQFTRNASGLVDALRKIGGLQAFGQLNSSMQSKLVLCALVRPW